MAGHIRSSAISVPGNHQPYCVFVGVIHRQRASPSWRAGDLCGVLGISGSLMMSAANRRWTAIESWALQVANVWQRASTTWRCAEMRQYSGPATAPSRRLRPDEQRQSDAHCTEKFAAGEESLRAVRPRWRSPTASFPRSSDPGSAVCRPPTTRVRHGRGWRRRPG